MRVGTGGRKSRPARIVVAVVVVQAALLGGYWVVEHRRSQETVAGQELSTAAPQRVEGRVQPLLLRTREGEPVELRTLERRTLVHFWATWCPACRVELPGLLALAQKRPLDVVAIALDKEWADVDRFLNGHHSTHVLLGDHAEVERAFDVHTLPVTFLVEPGGRLRLRFDGARDWTDSAFLGTWIDGE